MRSFEYKDSIFTEPSLVAPNLAQGEKRGGAEAAYVSFPSRKFTIDANVKIGESNISQIVYWTHDDEFDTKPNSITNLPEPVMNNVLSFLYTVNDFRNLSSTCRLFRMSWQSCEIWKRFVLTDFKDVLKHLSAKLGVKTTDSEEDQEILYKHIDAAVPLGSHPKRLYLALEAQRLLRIKADAEKESEVSRLSGIEVLPTDELPAVVGALFE